MKPRLVLCRCDLPFNKGRPVFAVCPDCELAWLEERLAVKNLLPDDHPAQAAYRALLDQFDADDRGRERADNHMADRRG